MYGVFGQSFIHSFRLAISGGGSMGKAVKIVLVVALILAIISICVLISIDVVYDASSAVLAARLYGYVVYPQFHYLSVGVQPNDSSLFDLGYNEFKVEVSGAYLSGLSYQQVQSFMTPVHWQMKGSRFLMTSGSDTVQLWQENTIKQSLFLQGKSIEFTADKEEYYTAYFSVSETQTLNSLYEMVDSQWYIHSLGISWLCYLSSDNVDDIAIGVPLKYLSNEGDTLIESFNAVDTFSEVIDYSNALGKAGSAVRDSSFVNYQQLDLSAQMQYAAEKNQLIGFCVTGTYDTIEPFVSNFTLVQVDKAV